MDNFIFQLRKKVFEKTYNKPKTLHPEGIEPSTLMV